MPIWLIIAITSAYVVGLFIIAWKGDKADTSTPTDEQSSIINGFGYALALAVYCTSWTYFGAVGTAAAAGWDYIWIYAGPAIVFLFFPQIIRRIGDIAQRESITSLSDFLSARYGKSQGVARLATLSAVAGSLPYIALQLKSVGLSFSAMAAKGDVKVEAANETVLFTALAMAVFAIIFGARQSDVTQHNRGLMRVLSFEALIKLAALIAVCILSVTMTKGGISEIMHGAKHHFEGYEFTARPMAILLLSTAAIICLPRQFHVSIIERQNVSEVKWARWVFPIYLLVTSLVVIPITVVGLSVFTSDTSPDLFVLALPLQQGEGLLALFVFLGGFSAATGMVIVSTIALSTMVTNDIIVPIFIDKAMLADGKGDGGARLIFIRRIVIISLLLLAYGYFRLAEDSAALAQIGLLSFAAAAQFAPALVGSIYWRYGKRTGVITGLLCGMGLWGYTLFFPAVFGIGNMQSFMPAIINPHGLLGYDFGDSLAHGVIWSLSVNTAAFVVVSLLSKERLRDRVQAVAFTTSGPEKLASSMSKSTEITSITPDGLKALAARFLEAEAVEHSFQKFRTDSGVAIKGEGNVEWQLVQHTEKLLARAIGASSARVIMSSVVAGVNVDLDDLLTIFDQTSHTERFEQHMLQSTLENVVQGISVVDAEQKLVAWNGAYIDLFEYPAELVRVGTPIQRLIEHNIKTGWIDHDNLSMQARRRVNYMRAGRPHIYERQNPDGRYLRIMGNPIPGGGYVTTFTDITEDKLREQELIEANETLEARVEERTQALQALTQDLENARREAVGANASKTRFLAAASHDLLQPLNAARLFLGAVTQDGAEGALLNKADHAIQSADELLKGLLNISRLDHSNIEPKMMSIPLAPLFEDMIEEARPMAEKAGLSIRFVPTSLSVEADADFLQSILRNFLSNARRYTKKGGILLGARRVSNQVKLQVWDTGLGISPQQKDMIFEEFQRFQDVDNLGIRGAGLGLTVAQRMADLMGSQIKLKSSEGLGSVFSITLDRGKPYQRLGQTKKKALAKAKTDLSNLTVLCIDDEPTILEGMKALLSKWNCDVLTCMTGEQALDLVMNRKVEVIIADYQLGKFENGLEVIEHLRPHIQHPKNVCLLTARRTNAVEEKSANDNIKLLSKPADPNDIKTFLLSCIKHDAAE